MKSIRKLLAMVVLTFSLVLPLGVGFVAQPAAADHNGVAYCPHGRDYYHYNGQWYYYQYLYDWLNAWGYNNHHYMTGHYHSSLNYWHNHGERDSGCPRH